MNALARPLAVDDVAVLQPLDREYARHTGVEEVVDEASLSFYGRSGHSFVLEGSRGAGGFLLAQAVWNGRRATVMVRRLVAVDEESLQALLEALVKSAYDAGVYDLAAEVPRDDKVGARALESCSFVPEPVTVYWRGLGSRARDTAR